MIYLITASLRFYKYNDEKITQILSDTYLNIVSV